MIITYYGHACFGIETANGSLLFDPFIRSNDLAKHIEVEKINCDFMLISHGHEDHVADALEIAKRTNCLLVSNYEIVTWYKEQGIHNTHAMNIGGEWNINGLRIKSVNAIHSSVLPDGTYAGNPGGFIVKSEDKCIYYAGDTALHLDMQLIGDMHQPDLAILPIGDNFTMGISDAIKASEMIRCKEIIGMHYDTFDPIKIDKTKAVDTFASAGINLNLMEIGSSFQLN